MGAGAGYAIAAPVAKTVDGRDVLLATRPWTQGRDAGMQCQAGPGEPLHVFQCRQMSLGFVR